LSVGTVVTPGDVLLVEYESIGPAPSSERRSQRLIVLEVLVEVLSTFVGMNVSLLVLSPEGLPALFTMNSLELTNSNFYPSRRLTVMRP